MNLRNYLNRTFFLFLIFMASTLNSLSLDLVKNGKAVATIVLPEDANPLTGQASKYLVEYIEKITGANLPIVRESDSKALSGTRVFLGATKAAQKAGIDLCALKYDGFIWKVSDGNLFIAGKDVLFPPGMDVNSNRACRGTVMGVFRLLEDYGNVRWFIPTPRGEVVPKADDFSVPDNLDKRQEPSFGYIVGGFSKYGNWSWANGIRMAVNGKVGDATWDAALRNYGDPEDLFKKDSTIFALIDGKRRLGRKVAVKQVYKYTHNMLCNSNPAFVEMNEQYISKLFDEGYDWVGYGKSDGWQRCECEKCDAMDKIDDIWNGKYRYWIWDWDMESVDKTVPAPERLWVPFNEIAKRLYEKYPDKKIMALVYTNTLIPSLKVRKFPPNVMFQLCKHEPKYFEIYSGYKHGVFVYWWGTFNIQGITPKTLARKVADEVRYLADHNVYGINICCGNEVWGLEGPAYYVMAKIAQDPNRKVDEVLDEYYRGIFHAAAPVMKEFFDLLEKRIEAGNSMQTEEESRKSVIAGRPEVYFPAAYPEEVLFKLENLLERARKIVKNDDFASNWIGLTDLQFRYLKIIATGFNLYRKYNDNPTPENHLRLAKIVEGRKAFLEELEELKENTRSEERRVGKECRSRWSPYH